jgi:iron(III) transport system substrate-binding protein
MAMSRWRGVLAPIVRCAAFASAWIAVLAPTLAAAAELPQSTREVLTKLSLDESVLAGLDKELAVPREWTERARQQGTLRLTGSWEPRRFDIFVRPFNERYPFVKIIYTSGSYDVRALRPLIAFEQGRYIADIVSGIGSAVSRYVAAGAFDDVRVLPAGVAVADAMKGADGSWIGIRMRYWCMSYNPSKVKKSDLPAQWDDLVANPRWQNGVLGLTNIPDTWLLPLWAAKGEDWGRRFTDALFLKLDPQLRKEGANALIKLVQIGELDAAIPSGDHEIMEYVKKGAPVGWHCPEPVPVAVSEMGLMKGSPNIDAARLFGNWLLSKEGQIAQFEQDHSPPIHKDLQLAKFVLFPDEVMGKKTAFRDADVNAQFEAFREHWNPLWERRKR